MNNELYAMWKTAVMSLSYEVLTMVVMKCYIFWDIAPCSLVKDNQRFGEKYRLSLQDQIISQAINRLEAGDQQIYYNTTTTTTTTTTSIRRHNLCPRKDPYPKFQCSNGSFRTCCTSQDGHGDKSVTPSGWLVVILYSCILEGLS
jgi:hypothetical protein